MNLLLLKELEDVKKERRLRLEEFDEMVSERKNQFISNAKADFKEFFESQGFSVTYVGGVYISRYGEMKVQLTSPETHETFMGSYTVIKLELSGFGGNNAKYSVRVNEKGKFPRVTSQIISQPKNEEEKIKREIDVLKKDLEELNVMCETFNQTQWAFGLVKELNWNQSTAYPQFDTFKELLQSVFQS